MNIMSAPRHKPIRIPGRPLLRWVPVFKRKRSVSRTSENVLVVCAKGENSCKMPSGMPYLISLSKFIQRTGSSASTNDDSATQQSFRAILKERLLITQPNDEIDDDIYDYRENCMSRDTDYETDLEMDYDGRFLMTLRKQSHLCCFITIKGISR